VTSVGRTNTKNQGLVCFSNEAGEFYQSAAFAGIERGGIFLAARPQTGNRRLAHAKPKSMQRG